MFVIFLCNAIGYRAKFALKKKGYPYSWFSHHFRDFKMIAQAISEEKNEEEKAKLKKVRLMLYSTPVLFIIGAAFFFRVSQQF
ncbi:hypothetical protein JIN82_07545 [Persicirhabdus sediminis]|uniref:Uncharacterized protein n=2 Tax=Persicirhabdus sediminis TaxID=454144 RepID=A0A8J7MC95_9BACT|nr:hypothetical protein [Persicirhabdus sediminis]